MKYTAKAPFDKGYNKMVSAVDNPEMMGMEFGVVKMTAGDIMNFDYAQEVVYDLMSGTVTFAWEGKTETVTRKDCTFRRTPLSPSLAAQTQKSQWHAPKTSAALLPASCVRRTA